MGNGEKFLDRMYGDLRVSKPVVHEQQRRKESDEADPRQKKPDEQIGDFLSVLERTHGHEDPRVLDRIKHSYHKQWVIRPEDVPESAFLLEQRILREQGYGDVEITDEFREQKRAQIVANQKHSLDRWVDYLSPEDAQYPTWAKYWAFISMLKMGDFQKREDEEGHIYASFKRRRKDTVSSFPLLNARALAETVSVMSEKLDQDEKSKDSREKVDNTSSRLSDTDFQKLLTTESFSKLYSQFLIEQPVYSPEGLQEIRGSWVTYHQHEAPDALVQSLEGYPLEWCTANPDTARSQLELGDFHVYYSYNETGQATVPRVAIRMEDDGIAEVRGIAQNQEIDPYISPVITAKMGEFGVQGDIYKKRADDMKELTSISKLYNKETSTWSRPLTKAECTFLYELDSSIEGFGYEKDPRVAELHHVRKDANLLEQDMLTIFECEPNQIATSKEQLERNTQQGIETKAYIGPIHDIPNFFVTYATLEHIYISFPECPILKRTIEIGGEAKGQLSQRLREVRVNFSEHINSMLDSADFTTDTQKRLLDTIRLTVGDLGVPNGVPFEHICAKATELGLDLCPPEVGPHYRLQCTDQPMHEYFSIGMKPISDSGGLPFVFSLYRDGDGLWLHSDWADPQNYWYADREFVFSPRK